MLWNKRKPSDPSRVAEAPTASSYRVAEPDRALTSLGTLLKTYGRFAFDTAEPAARFRERCDEWAQRLLLGELRRESAAQGTPGGDAGAAETAPSLLRDFRGAERFFEELRKAESEFVKQNLAGLRAAALALARSLGKSAGEDRGADAKLEQRLTDLSRALQQGDVGSITRSANSVIDTARSAMAERRERDARQAQKLDKEMRTLREQLADDLPGAGSDELTGLFGRAQCEQQLEQLAAIGSLLAERPWLVVIDVGAGKTDPGKRSKAVPDRTLREVAHSISRTFLRRQDFAARTAPHELAVLVVDMNQSEIVKAVERLLSAVAGAARSLSTSETPNLAIGIARLRLDEDPDHWRARAHAVLQRAREPGSTGWELAAG